jgi:hypothetical protein
MSYIQSVNMRRHCRNSHCRNSRFTALPSTYVLVTLASICSSGGEVFAVLYLQADTWGVARNSAVYAISSFSLPRVQGAKVEYRFHVVVEVMKSDMGPSMAFISSQERRSRPEYIKLQSTSLSESPKHLKLLGNVDLAFTSRRVTLSSNFSAAILASLPFTPES